MKNNRVLKFLLKLAVSLSLLVWLVFSVNWKEVLFYLKMIDMVDIMLYFAFLVFGMLISSYKWRELAKFKGINGATFYFFKLYLAGTFINNFMPSFIGGDGFKAYQIGKSEKKYSEAFSTVVIDRLTGLIGALLLSFIFMTLNISQVLGNEKLKVTYVLIALAIASLGAFFLIKNLGFLKKFFKFIPEKILNFLKVVDGFSSASILSRSVIFSFAFALIGTAGANLVLFSAVGADIMNLDYLSIIFVISILSSIPISINNIGVKEWAYVFFFGIFGVSSSLVVTVAILSRFLQMLLSFAALPIYLKREK